ncbi:MAG: hypothetical protein HOY75_35695, partial [Streptomyces sp.]|nr:hypothetical protein [Streptomyces sp.]
GWGRVGSWGAVEEALRDSEHAGPGSVALVLARRPGNGLGHAFAAYHTADGVVWADASKPAEHRVSDAPPELGLLFDARAVLVGPSGRVVADALEPSAESSSVAHALLDFAVRDEYGALGTEVEHRYPLDIGPLTPELLRRLGVTAHMAGQPDLRKVVLAEGPGIRVTVDATPFWLHRATGRLFDITVQPPPEAGFEKVSRFIPEVDTDPAAVVPGERRRSWAELAVQGKLVRDRLAWTGQTGEGGRPVPLRELLGDLPGWTLTEAGHLTTVNPLALGYNGRDYVQFSLGGAPVSRMMAWDHAIDRLGTEQTRSLFVAGRRFGAQAAGELVGWLGYRGAAVADPLPFLAAIPDVSEVWGYGWMAFTQSAAGPVGPAFAGLGTLFKNRLSVASRNPFDSVRRALRPGTRDFLDRRHDQLSEIAHTAMRGEVERTFAFHRPGTAVPDGFFDIGTARRPSPREHLTFALTGLTSQGRRIGQYESVGMDELPGLDTEGGLAVPLAADEFRAYGIDGWLMTEEQIGQAGAELVELGRRMYEEAVAARVPLSPEVLVRSVERIVNHPVVLAFAPFLPLAGNGVPRVDGPPRPLLTLAEGMTVARALAGYALGHIRLPADSPEYRLMATAVGEASALLESGSVPAGVRARVEEVIRSAATVLTAVHEAPPPTIEWREEVEALDGTPVLVDRVSLVRHRNASDVPVGVSARRDGAWQQGQESYGLLPLVEYVPEARWGPGPEGAAGTPAVVSDGSWEEAPFGRVFLVGLDGDGTAAWLPVRSEDGSGESAVAFGYKAVIDCLFACAPELTGRPEDTDVLVAGADVAGPYAAGRDPLEWPVAGQVLANQTGFDGWVWASALGLEFGFTSGVEEVVDEDGVTRQKRVVRLQLAEGDALVGFRREPSSVQLAAQAERLTGDRTRVGDVRRWRRAARLVYGPLLENDEAAFEALLRGFHALDLWRAREGDVSPLTWNALRGLVTAYASGSGRATTPAQALPLALAAAAAEVGVDLGPSFRFDLTPRYEPRRAWEEAPASSAAGRALTAVEPPAPVHPAPPLLSGPRAAVGVAQLAAARPLTGDATDSGGRVLVAPVAPQEPAPASP